MRPNDELDLAQWGIDGKVIAMPGHTPGSIVVLLVRSHGVRRRHDRGWLVGGLLSPHSPGEHLYQADPVQNRRNIQTLLDRGVQKFYLGHGGPVTRADVVPAFGLRP